MLDGDEARAAARGREPPVGVEARGSRDESDPGSATAAALRPGAARGSRRSSRTACPRSARRTRRRCRRRARRRRRRPSRSRGRARDDVRVGQGLARRLHELGQEGQAPLGVGHDPVLLRPLRGGQEHVGEARGLRRMIGVLHDHQLGVAKAPSRPRRGRASRRRDWCRGSRPRGPRPTPAPRRSRAPSAAGHRERSGPAGTPQCALDDGARRLVA